MTALRNPLRPFEWTTLGLALAAVVFLRARGLRVDERTIAFMAGPMLGRLPMALGLGLLLHAAALAARRRPLLGWMRSIATFASAATWLRVWLAAMVMTYAYSWLKVSIPLVRESLLDPQLWALDRVLHFGVSPSVLAAELVAGTPLAPWLDAWYGFWVWSILGVLSYVFVAGELAKRRNFVCACALLWLIGVWIYVALPALGPCFASPDVFAGVLADMPHARGSQSALWHNYGRMLAGRDGSLKQFNPYYGVAALPSLHVGAHWMFALWARRHERWLFAPFAVATLLTFLGSLASGWHYAVDGYLGMLLAWGAVVAADRLEPVPEPQGSADLRSSSAATEGSAAQPLP